MRTSGTLAAAAAMLALGACATSTAEDRLVEAGHVQLTGGEIRAAFAGNTILGKGQVSDYAIYYADAGELRGRITWEDNSATDRGVWEVTGEDLYCRRWLEQWGDRERQCWRIYRSGDAITWVNPDGTVSAETTLHAGNAENL